MNEILQGNTLDVLKTLDAESVQCVVTSPPYFGLRDYGVADQLGLEKTPSEFVAKIVEIFREVHRVLRKDGTVWLNLGDSYGRQNGKGFNKNMRAGHANRNTTMPAANRNIKLETNLPEKNLIGIPWRVAFALQDAGWILRQDIIWSKPNPMPESVIDRCTKSHEYIFLLSKYPKYFFNKMTEPAHYDGRKDTAYKGGAKDMAGGAHERWKEDEHGNKIRNRRSVWEVSTHPFADAHFATFPEKLIEPMVMAGSPRGGVVLDPFMGAGTTAVVAQKLGRDWLGIELNPEYIEIAKKRIAGTPVPLF